MHGRIALTALIVMPLFGYPLLIPYAHARSPVVLGFSDDAETRAPAAGVTEVSSLRSRAEAFLRRPNPFGREQPSYFDIVMAHYVAGEQWADPDFFESDPLSLLVLRTFVERMPRLCDEERKSYHLEQLAIVSAIDAEFRREKPARTASDAKWRDFLPPPNPPHYVGRAMNDKERELLSVLKEALAGDIVQGLHRFEELYRRLDQCAVPWDTKLGEAIHDFASKVKFPEPIKYLGPKEESRKVFGPAELRERIRKVLAAQPPGRDIE